MTLLFASIALDMAQVLGFVFIFLCYLNCINSNGWITSPITAFVFYRGLDLRLISKRGIVRYNLIFIFVESLIMVLLIDIVLILFGRLLVSFQVSEINLFSPRRWLQAGLYFCVDSFFSYFVSRIQVLSSIV